MLSLTKAFNLSASSSLASAKSARTMKALTFWPRSGQAIPMTAHSVTKRSSYSIANSPGTCRNRDLAVLELVLLELLHPLDDMLGFGGRRDARRERWLAAREQRAVALQGVGLSVEVVGFDALEECDRPVQDLLRRSVVDAESVRSADDADTDLRERGSVGVDALVAIADDEHVVWSFGDQRPQKSPLRSFGPSATSARRSRHCAGWRSCASSTITAA